MPTDLERRLAEFHTMARVHGLDSRSTVEAQTAVVEAARREGFAQGERHRVFDIEQLAKALYQLFGTFESDNHGVPWSGQGYGYLDVWRGRARIIAQTYRTGELPADGAGPGGCPCGADCHSELAELIRDAGFDPSTVTGGALDNDG